MIPLKAFATHEIGSAVVSCWRHRPPRRTNPLENAVRKQPSKMSQNLRYRSSLSISILVGVSASFSGEWSFRASAAMGFNCPDRAMLTKSVLIIAFPLFHMVRRLRFAQQRCSPGPLVTKRCPSINDPHDRVLFLRCGNKPVAPIVSTEAE
jgi:hypothetical protein